MNRTAFENIVRRTLDTLPPLFHRALENVAVVVEDEPDPALLDELGMEGDEELFGLYSGVSLLEREVSYTGLPDQVLIFMGPLLRVCGSRAELREEIRRTVIHELGHHMGLSDDEMVY